VSDRERPAGGVFNIGSQQAGAIFQAAGDQVVHHGEGTLGSSALRLVADLRSALAARPLSNGTAAEVERELALVEAELERPTPDTGAVADRLERLTGVLGRAGALATAAEGLTTPLRHLAAWLGPAGAGLLHLLG
jgi:hypothetical protein